MFITLIYNLKRNLNKVSITLSSYVNKNDNVYGYFFVYCRKILKTARQVLQKRYLSNTHLKR